MFSNIEETFAKLPKHLNSAITKLFYCFSKGWGLLKMEELQKFHFFWFLNLHNLLERACNHIKLYILKVHLEMCLQITYAGTENFFDAFKPDQNEKSDIFQETGIPKIDVQLFENFQT